ncbi:MAG: hypothetical protein JO056_00390 [Alphaproteobacteria bacterium]|nr:hypothetical protein [Alphaproteobacteria bacterium]
MRKFSMMAAAAALVVSGSAQAKVPVLDLGDICHFMAVVVDHSTVSGFSHFTCQTGNFVGVIGRVQGTEGRSMIASVRLLDKPKKNQFLLRVDYPLVNGGGWTMYYTKAGYTAKVYQSGTYSVIK